MIPFPILVTAMIAVGKSCNFVAKAHSTESIWAAVCNVCNTVLQYPHCKLCATVFNHIAVKKSDLLAKLTLSSKMHKDTIKHFEMIGFCLYPGAREYLASAFSFNEKAAESFTYNFLFHPGKLTLLY